jgi:2-oxoglutarate dehydrogenase E1 component
MLQSPIFHVNGEDPEAVAQVVRLGLDFRQNFRRDVVIDMYCYRRRGHNEGDEPAFTQPLMYRAIRARPSVRDGYLERLLQLNGVTRDEADEIARVRRSHLEDELSAARSPEYAPRVDQLASVWRGYHGGADDAVKEVDTAVDRRHLAAMLESLARVPKGFRVHPKLERILETRRQMARGEHPLDWATAEALALGSLSLDGFRVRLSGQDSTRGTFSQRHTVLHDHESGVRHVPLAHLSPQQRSIDIYDSPLSETGVLGFEYGYSLDAPDCLTLWEAQFGDFINAAQVIVDQFIASGEQKWHRLSGLVLLLPHGFEGRGRALERAPRALPRAVGGRQHPGRQSDHAGLSTSTCCAARRCGGGRSPWWS